MRASRSVLLTCAALTLVASTPACTGGEPPGEGTGGAGGDLCEDPATPPDPAAVTWSTPLYAELLAASGDALFMAAPRTDSPACHVARLGAQREEVWSLDLTASLVVCSALAADAAGNLFVAGYFKGEIAGTGVTPVHDDFDLLSEATAGDASPDDKGDAFLAKIDPQGALAWIVPFGGPGADRSTRLAVSPDGHAAVTALFSPGGVSFGEDRIGQLGDAPLALFTPDGALSWTALLPSPSGALSLDPRSLAVGPSAEVYLSVAEAGFATIDVARFDDGALTWSASFAATDVSADGGGFPFGPTLHVSGDHLLLAGEQRDPDGLAGTTDLGTGPLTAYSYLASWTLDATPEWSQPLAARSLFTSLSPTGDLHLAARSAGPVTLGLPPEPIDLEEGSLFAARLSPTGQLLAATPALSTDESLTLLAIATSGDGEDAIAGYSTGYCPIDFGDGALDGEAFLIGAKP